MKYFVSLVFVLLFSISGFAQGSNKYLQILDIHIYSQLNQSPASSQNNEFPIRREPPTEAELENVKFVTSRSPISDNQSISVLFMNLGDKDIKSVTFLLRITNKGKKVIQEECKSKARWQLNGRFFVSDRFFSNKDLSDNNPNLNREIIIKRIEFVDGTKLKF